MHKYAAPKNIGQKLGLVLAFYAACGFMAILLFKQPVFALSVYLHGMTFVFLGMFIASSAGEVLFNNEESDILLHRPVTPKALLLAKIRVMIEISLWLAGAFNLVGLFAGMFASNGDWRFLFVHAFSTVLEALFCTSSVVLFYQLCLRWFGRERLDNVMTTAQVIVAVGAVVAGQLLPQIISRFGNALTVAESSPWIALLPPAWFAGIDDALAGSAALKSWILFAVALLVTSVVFWLAFVKLANSYQTGLLAINERVSKTGSRPNSRFIEKLAGTPPLSWWLRDPVTRASFLLTTAYLLRDRDVKLRVYPGIAPILVMPLIMLINPANSRLAGFGGFGIPFCGVYLGLIPLLSLNLLQYSQQWQAADVFRSAPIPRPSPLCSGARKAVLCFLTLPLIPLFALIIWLLTRQVSALVLLLPGLISLPVFTLIPSLGTGAVPLSKPVDTAKAAGRSIPMIVVMFVAFGIAGASSAAWAGGWFQCMLIVEAVIAVIAYVVIRMLIEHARWQD